MWSAAFVLSFLIHISPASHKRDKCANSVDSDQMPQNAASDQGLHCLHSVQIVQQNMTVVNTYQTPLFRKVLIVEESTRH